MTSTLDREFNNLLNPAFGAVVLRSFADGFCDSDPNEIPLHHLFLPIPLISLEEIADAIISTNRASGLRKAVSKLDDDTLYALHYRVMDFRQLSFDAIKLAINSHLILLDVDSGMFLHPNNQTPKVPVSQKGTVDASRKLGTWFSDMSTHEICTTLRVNF